MSEYEDMIQAMVSQGADFDSPLTEKELMEQARNVVEKSNKINRKQKDAIINNFGLAIQDDLERDIRGSELKFGDNLVELVNKAGEITEEIEKARIQREIDEIDFSKLNKTRVSELEKIIKQRQPVITRRTNIFNRRADNIDELGKLTPEEREKIKIETLIAKDLTRSEANIFKDTGELPDPEEIPEELFG